MKGSILFNPDINIEVDVDPSAEEGARLVSAKNLVDGQEAGGGGEPENVNVTFINTLEDDLPCEEIFTPPGRALMDNGMLTIVGFDEIISGEAETTIQLAVFPGTPTRIVYYPIVTNFQPTSSTENISYSYVEDDDYWYIDIFGPGSITIEWVN